MDQIFAFLVIIYLGRFINNEIDLVVAEKVAHLFELKF